MSDTTPAELGTDFVEVVDTRTGIPGNVPRDFLDHPVLGRFIEPTAAQRERDGNAAVDVEVEHPDGTPADLTGRPTEDWGKDAITAYADAAGIDLTGHKASKAAMVARITEVLDTPPTDDDTVVDPTSPDANQVTDETPAAGDEE